MLLALFIMFLNFFVNTGDVCNKPHKERSSTRALTISEEMFVLGLIMESPCLYLHEVCQQLEEISGFSVSISTICRLLHCHGLSRKKVQKIALERRIDFRSSFMAHILQFPREQLVWIDEMGSDRRNAMRQYGYALLGVTPLYCCSQARGQRISAISALSSSGMVTTEFRTGSVNSDAFYDFVRGSLIPNMHPYDGIAPKSVAIMDNCSIHHIPAISDLFSSAGILLIFLPPYSPDYNPIELAFSSVKYFLKQHDIVMQAMQDPIPLIKCAFDQISVDMCNSWITYCGYA